MEAVKLDSWHTVSKFVQLIPETLPYDHVKRSFHHHDIDLWYVFLIFKEILYTYYLLYVILTRLLAMLYTSSTSMQSNEIQRSFRYEKQQSA